MSGRWPLSTPPVPLPGRCPRSPPPRVTRSSGNSHERARHHDVAGTYAVAELRELAREPYNRVERVAEDGVPSTGDDLFAIQRHPRDHLIKVRGRVRPHRQTENDRVLLGVVRQDQGDVAAEIPRVSMISKEGMDALEASRTCCGVTSPCRERANRMHSSVSKPGGSGWPVVRFRSGTTGGCSRTPSWKPNCSWMALAVSPTFQPMGALPPPRDGR